MHGLSIEIKPEERILGMYVTCNGSDTVNRRLVTSCLEAAYSRNQAVLCRHWLDEEARLRFWGNFDAWSLIWSSYLATNARDVHSTCSGEQWCGTKNTECSQATLGEHHLTPKAR